jgi:phage shock protein PspC (stress-responsive transcriptional regulator)
MTPKKLYRSSTDKVIAGVCGGLAKYLEVDATLVRVIFILLFFMGGGGVILYIVLMIAIPLDSSPTVAQPLNAGEIATNAAEAIKTAASTVKEKIHHESRHSWSIFFGLILVFIGVINLSRILFPSYIIFPPLQIFWPVIFVLLGLFIVMRHHKD